MAFDSWAWARSTWSKRPFTIVIINLNQTYHRRATLFLFTEKPLAFDYYLIYVPRQSIYSTIPSNTLPIPEHPTITDTYQPPKDHVYTLQYSAILNLSFKNNRLHFKTTKSIATRQLLIDLLRSFIDQITYNTLKVIFLSKPSPPYRPGGIEKYWQIYTIYKSLRNWSLPTLPRNWKVYTLQYPLMPSRLFHPYTDQTLRISGSMSTPKGLS